MNLYTIYSESHYDLYLNYFLPSLPSDVVLYSKEFEQIGDGEYYNSGWYDMCKKKIEFFIEICKINMGSIFIFSDVDVQFFSDKIVDKLLSDLGDFDIACQDDATAGYCSGFFICRANERTLNMFEQMLRVYVKDDQRTLNINLYLCKHKFISRSILFSYCHWKVDHWKGNDFNVPEGIYIHHANWVIGLDNKIKLLDKVKNIIDKR